MEKQYQICARCVMDTTDPEITFDSNGVCNHCLKYDKLVTSLVWTEAERKIKLPALVEKIKRAGKGKEYDCIIGVSGGVDSTYVAYMVKQLGLRPLAVHLDNGWNSSLAVTNIHKALNKLEIDLDTEVLDWEEFKDLQLAFLKASTPDSEIPTDHAITAVLSQVAAKQGINISSAAPTSGLRPFCQGSGRKGCAIGNISKASTNDSVQCRSKRFRTSRFGASYLRAPSNVRIG